MWFCDYLPVHFLHTGWKLVSRIPSEKNATKRSLMMLVRFSLKSQSSTQNGLYITWLVFVSLLFDYSTVGQKLPFNRGTLLRVNRPVRDSSHKGADNQSVNTGRNTHRLWAHTGGSGRGDFPTGGLGRVGQQKITRFSLAREMNKGDLFLLLYRLCGTLEWYEICRNYRLVCIPSMRHTSLRDNQIIALSVQNWGC